MPSYCIEVSCRWHVLKSRLSLRFVEPLENVPMEYGVQVMQNDLLSSVTATLTVNKTLWCDMRTDNIQGQAGSL